MSIESTPSTSPMTEQATDDDQDIYVILWFWKEKPGGGLVHCLTDFDAAEILLSQLGEHGNPSKYFKLVRF